MGLEVPELELEPADGALLDQLLNLVVVSQTAVWYRSGKPPVPLRWVLVRDPQGEFATQALLCTDLAVEPAQIRG